MNEPGYCLHNRLGTPLAPARALPMVTNVIVLKPGQIHSLRVSLDDPWWSVSKTGKPEEAKRLSDLRQEWNARFRFEYRPPDRAASEGLPNGNLIWHGHLASRMFSLAEGRINTTTGASRGLDESSSRPPCGQRCLRTETRLRESMRGFISVPAIEFSSKELILKYECHLHCDL